MKAFVTIVICMCIIAICNKTQAMVPMGRTDNYTEPEKQKMKDFINFVSKGGVSVDVENAKKFAFERDYIKLGRDLKEIAGKDKTNKGKITAAFLEKMGREHTFLSYILGSNFVYL